MKVGITVALLAGALSLAPAAPAPAAAEPAPAVEATAPATLAGELRAKAAAARAEARRHRTLASAPTHGRSAGRANVQLRHRRLAERLESLAMDYEEMARMHEAEGAQAG